MLMIDAVRLHVRFEGRSEDLDLPALGLRHDASDAEALVCHLLDGSRRGFELTLRDLRMTAETQ